MFHVSYDSNIGAFFSFFQNFDFPDCQQVGEGR